MDRSELLRASHRSFTVWVQRSCAWLEMEFLRSSVDDCTRSHYDVRRLSRDFTSNILLRRARRLRKLTGNPNYKSQSELDQANMTPRQFVVNALIKPMQIMFLDPAILFTNVYSAFIYGVVYTLLEAIPLVYMGIYGFNIGLTGVGEYLNVVIN